ncbi:MAG: anti-sigma factor family protein [Candidatus Acidiferrales bacterium]
MDHLEAVRLQAAEKYVLGELPPEVREQFEEHYFDCSECAKDLKALTTFVTASRIVFEEREFSSPAPSRGERAVRPGWFSWLRPVIAVPAIAALAAIVVFQNAVTIPSAKKHGTQQSAAEVYEATYRLQGATRGGNIAKVTVRPSESFALEFDFTPSQVFASYKGNLVDSSGHSVRTFGLTGEQSNRELHVLIPGGIVHAGNYELVVVGDTGTLKQGPQNSEVLRIPFIVESEL